MKYLYGLVFDLWRGLCFYVDEALADFGGDDDAPRGHTH